MVETLFDLLGFRFAREGSKASPFATAFEMLGLRVDLSRVQERLLTVGHTEKRKAELHGYIQEVLTAGCLENPRPLNDCGEGWFSSRVFLLAGFLTELSAS